MVAPERCARARLAMSADLDGEASPADVRHAVTHVRRCAACRVFLAGVVAATEAVRAVHVIRPSSAGHGG